MTMRTITHYGRPVCKRFLKGHPTNDLFNLYCTRIIFHISVPGGGWEASASNARLYMRDDHTNKRIGTWCAAYGQTDGQWLQIDLGQVKYVSAVATQGMC